MRTCSTVDKMKRAASCIACLLLLLTCVLCEPITFKDCTDGGQTLVVNISPCPSQPCSFNYSTTATVKVTFKSPVDSATLNAEIYGILAGVKIPWSMPNHDGCKACNLSCPVTSGKVYTYVSTLTMPKDAPKIRLVVEWLLLGANGEKHFCFDFPMSIT